MKCPKCEYVQDGRATACLKCGIVFFKHEQAQRAPKREHAPGSTSKLWIMPEEGNPVYRIGRILLLIALSWLSWDYIFTPIGPYSPAATSFFHNINLPFHEAGHILFRPFGAFITSLGGTLGQLIMPLLCLSVLLLKSRDAFGAAVCLWWFGESFLDLVPYIDDARSLSMPLLGGNVGHGSPYGFHDWEFILTESGLLHLDHALAKTAHILGSIFMITALLWMLLLLFRKHTTISKKPVLRR